ncbi:MAG: iron export ABC transporter permease subunit FetB [Deltaproteobacteria bacterium]|nr:iron export ABC transporter permease subunit FetB [Deltaproteobacteria bacterium]
MSAPLIALGWKEILFLFGIIIAAVAWSGMLRLGLSRLFLVAATRAMLQLGAVGLVIGWVFRQSEWYIILALLSGMALVAGYTGANRCGVRMPGLWLLFTGTMGAVTALLMLYLTQLVLRLDTWDPRYLVPLGGMLLGNVMTAASLSVERLASSLSKATGEVETLLALGAAPGRALERLRREAIHASLIPTLNTMLVVGVVTIPGMMTGQMLGGSPPMQAALYQMLILFSIAFASLLTATVTVYRIGQQFFTPAAQLKRAQLSHLN